MNKRKEKRRDKKRRTKERKKTNYTVKREKFARVKKGDRERHEVSKTHTLLAKKSDTTHMRDKKRWKPSECF